MCEVIACGGEARHPGVPGGRLGLAGLAALAPGEAEGAVDGSVVELGEARRAHGEVVEGRGGRGGGGGVVLGEVVVVVVVVEVRGQQAVAVGQEARGEGARVLDRQLLLDEVGQGLAGDVEGVEAQVVVLLLLGGGAEAEGRLPVRGGGHRYRVWEGEEEQQQEEEEETKPYRST